MNIITNYFQVNKIIKILEAKDAMIKGVLNNPELLSGTVKKE
jgi:hypothetical protein